MYVEPQQTWNNLTNSPIVNFQEVITTGSRSSIESINNKIKNNLWKSDSNTLNPEIDKVMNYIKMLGGNAKIENEKTNETILVIPDLHIPAELDKALEFCKKIKIEYSVDKVIFIGDIIDNYCLSLHMKNANFNYTATQEIEAVKYLIKDWYKAFPNATIIGGNHDMSRLFKTANVTGIPSLWFKELKDILETPNWEFKNEYVYQNVYYNHGEKAEAKKVAIYKGMSTVQGHRHTLSYIDYPRKDIFAVQVGTLVDRNKMNFDYAKHTLSDWWNGVCVIKNNIPMLIPYND
jgi:predicted phosphodiesterase